MIRAVCIRVLAVAIGTIMPLLLLEVVFRLLPVSESRQVVPVNDRNPIYHFKPNTTLTLSSGWNFAIVAKKRTNNRGFFSDIDYLRDERRKLVVIGDSYVEAAQVENSKSVHGVLNSATPPGGQVYGIGSSGAPLSQYLAYAEYASKEFSPIGYAFVIIANDFDESLPMYRQTPGFHYFVKNPQGTLAFTRGPDYRPARSKEILRESALARYLFLNLDMPSIWQRLQLKLNRKTYIANTANDLSPERLANSRAAIDIFLRELPRRIGNVPALFVVDGIRPQLYSAGSIIEAQGSFFDLMRNYLMSKAKKAGYEVIDMQPVFIDHYKSARKPFEFPSDAHWNELGHQLAAEQIINSTLWKSIFQGKLAAPAGASVRH